MPIPTSRHYAIIERKTPAWLKAASRQTHEGLHHWRQAPDWLSAAIQDKPKVAKAWAAEHARHRQHQAQVKALFEHLPEPLEYARRVLSEAITERFGLIVDVDASYLVDARLIDTSSAHDTRQAVQRATRSLLQSALHNFDAGATEDHGMDSGNAPLKRSVILDHRGFMGTLPITNTLDIPAEAFADLCRTLDIGGKYHDMLHAIYYPAATPGQSAEEAALKVYRTLGQAEQSAFRQSLHLAYLKGDISQAFYDAALVAPLAERPSTASPVIDFNLLTLWEVELAGVALVILNTKGQRSFTLYTPDDSVTPMKEFPSMHALEANLRDRLLADIRYLDKHIADRDKASLGVKLRDRLTPLQWSPRGLHERIQDPQATLHPVADPLQYAFLSVMAFQKAQKHEQDAVYHAVPTYVVDLRTALAHRQSIANRTLTALNLAGFLVPGLGEAMLAICVMQLAHEVYEGIESWHNDERSLACDYLVDVIENIALMAAFAAATAKIKEGVEAIKDGALPKPPEALLPPSFIEELEEVELADGEARLWKPDSQPYHTPQALPDGLEADDIGLVHHQHKRWLRLQGRQYVVKQGGSDGHYRLQHPTRALAHEPIVRHNGAGAWLLPAEQPLQWARTTLQQRMASAEHFTEDMAIQALRASGIDEDVLRHALTEHWRLPAMLEDTLVRFKLDMGVRKLPSTEERSAEFNRAYARLPASQAPGAELMQRVYPSLPNAVTDELIDNATADEKRLLETGKVPLRLAEEVLVYQRQIRLSRAYEGLYLGAVRNWDTDRLVIHSLQQLAGWPQDIKLELREHTRWPIRRDSIGPQDARPYTLITRAEAGYIVHGDATSNAPVNAHENLYSALCEALPEAMTALGRLDPHGLRRRLQDGPLLPRTELRRLLGMQPTSPGYRSPMRLADGRLGYPLSGGLRAEQGISRQTLLDAVAATGLTEHTRRTADQVLMMVASSGRTRLQVLDRLQRLREQRNELQSRLEDWSEAIAPNSDQAARDYESLRQAIMQHWYDSALVESGEHSAELSLERVPLADIPVTLPEFFTSRIRTLRLVALPPGTLSGWAQHERLLRNLLRQMPQLESLEINRPHDPRATPSSFFLSIPTIVAESPGLRTLAVTHQNIALTSTDVNMLAGLSQLRRLDLSGNRLAQHDSPSFNDLTLDYLGLDRMQLNQWPTGLGSPALGRVAHVSMRDNNLRSLPGFLFDEPRSLPDRAILSLQGNPLNENQLQRLLLNEGSLNVRINADRSAEFTDRLERAMRERQQMRDAIDGWARASGSSTPLTQAILEDRQRIEAALTRFWENQERGLPHLRLRLENVALENFPSRLPGFFGERVTALTLSGLRGTTAQLDTFLGRFPNIRRLTIDSHVSPTYSLPLALARLPRLAHLEWRNMGLEIDQTMINLLGNLHHLSTLDLSGNRIGTITRVPESLASSLTSLTLTNMNLQAWPRWCDDLLPLELLDLSSNGITELPEHILQNVDNPMPISSISLFDNPLSDDTVQRVRTYSDSQHVLSFAMDIPDDLLPLSSSDEGSLVDHPHFPEPYSADDTPHLQDWMLGTPLQNEALRNCWGALEKLDNGENLLRLVGRLRNSAPYLDPTEQSGFCERVRLVLVTGASNDQYRPVMNSIAEAALPDPRTGSQTCHDGALQEFNNIELYLMSERLLEHAGDTLQSLYRRLLQLYRVGQLELIAQQRSGPGDLVSVRLAYRRALAKDLDLPIADSMRFRSAAQLQHNELSEVLEEVRNRENGETFIHYLLANAHWTDRLRAEHAERFAELEEGYRERVLAASEKDLPLQDELTLQHDLEADWKQQQQALLAELTYLHVRHA